jgi:hypothetical protein
MLRAEENAHTQRKRKMAGKRDEGKKSGGKIRRRKDKWRENRTKERKVAGK